MCNTKYCGQAQSVTLRLGQALGVEAPDTCVDAHPGFKSSTFAQAPFRDPFPTSATPQATGGVTEDCGADAVLVRPVPKSPGSDRHRFEYEDFSGARPQTVVQTAHPFFGRSCPGCACNDCQKTLGGKQGKFCVSCYRETGLTFCKECHTKRQGTAA